MNITGHTKITGLFGDPVTHSLSPAMHNSAYQHLNLPYVYVPFSVARENLPQAVQAIRALNLTGVNITVPHKEAIIPYLDILHHFAERCGAVNTVVNNNGTLTGYNTDGAGFIDSLRENGFDPLGKKVVILGAGGSARAIAAALLDHRVGKIVLMNRTLEKANIIAALGPEKFTVQPLNSNPDLAGTALVVNTLSIPFKREGGWLLDLSPAAGALFYDLRYGKMPADFLTYAREIKSPGLDGLGMLLHQGARAFKLFTGVEAPVREMNSCLLSYKNSCS